MDKIEKTGVKSEVVNDDIEIGDIVLNLNGRDGGRRYLVISRDGELLTLADGRSRRIEKPKRKKSKHVSKVAGADDIARDAADDKSANVARRVVEKLRGGEKVTNAELRRVLSEYASVSERSRYGDESVPADSDVQPGQDPEITEEVRSLGKR
jgi:ribosomal protein L14E/L6E/L27E